MLGELYCTESNLSVHVYMFEVTESKIISTKGGTHRVGICLTSKEEHVMAESTRHATIITSYMGSLIRLE